MSDDIRDGLLGDKEKLAHDLRADGRRVPFAEVSNESAILFASQSSNAYTFTLCMRLPAVSWRGSIDHTTSLMASTSSRAMFRLS